MILDPFLLLFVAYEVRYLPLPCRKLLSGSQATQRSKVLDPFYFQATSALMRLMTSLCGALHRFAVFACR